MSNRTGCECTVLRLGSHAERLRIGEVADHWMSIARGNPRGFLVVAHERRHVVTGAHDRVEHGRTVYPVVPV